MPRLVAKVRRMSMLLPPSTEASSTGGPMSNRVCSVFVKLTVEAMLVVTLGAVGCSSGKALHVGTTGGTIGTTAGTTSATGGNGGTSGALAGNTGGTTDTVGNTGGGGTPSTTVGIPSYAGTAGTTGGSSGTTGGAGGGGMTGSTGESTSAFGATGGGGTVVTSGANSSIIGGTKGTTGGTGGQGTTGIVGGSTSDAGVDGPTGGTDGGPDTGANRCSTDRNTCVTDDDCTASNYKPPILSAADCYCIYCPSYYGWVASKAMVGDCQSAYSQFCGSDWQSQHCEPAECDPAGGDGSTPRCIADTCQWSPN